MTGRYFLSIFLRATVHFFVHLHDQRQAMQTKYLSQGWSTSQRTEIPTSTNPGGCSF
jgi:hypothetical protein